MASQYCNSLLPVLLLLLLSLFSVNSVFAIHRIPRLSIRKQTLTHRDPNKNFSNTRADSQNFKKYVYTQTLDHFNYNPQSYSTFPQRYVIDYNYWGGANSNSPIFVFLGAEEQLEYDMDAAGFLRTNAPHFKALIVYIEHRYYGQSVPDGTMEQAMKDANIRGYFNSAQAMADYAKVLLYIKQSLRAEKSPVIVFGASYGGMLASWFRLKYPHVALGALASSAPILYFDNITPENGYYSLVTRDFEDASKSCAENIRKSWSEIDQIASLPWGLSFLTSKFKMCNQLQSSDELKLYLESIYVEAAQYNAPPEYPVSVICSGMDGAPSGTDLLGRIFTGVNAYRKSRNYPCHQINDYLDVSQTAVGWTWQACTEMVMPMGITDDTMFQASPFDLNAYMKYCKNEYGVLPRPHWVTTYYGGNDIKLILQRFASNIIFSNGLKDPFSSGGVLEDISDTILAISTANGSHCLDIGPPTESDPIWLVEQRNKEVKVIEGWISKYYADLKVLK